MPGLTIGLNIAADVFRDHGVDRNGTPVGSVAIRQYAMIFADKTKPMPDETDPYAGLSACI